MQYTVRYEGLREVLKALRETESDLLVALEASFRRVGDLIRNDARGRLVRFGQEHGRGFSFAEVAAGLETRVRTSGNTDHVVTVGQLNRTSSNQLARRPNVGDLQMKKALLPARTARFDEAVELVEDDVAQLLARHGF